MYILVSLSLLIIGILVLPLTLHIQAKEKNTYFETEVRIVLFGYALYRQRREGDWLKILLQKLKKSRNADISKKKKNRSSEMVLILLRVGKWKKVIWYSELGLDEASQTAFMTGLLQILQGIFRQLLLQYTSCKTDIYCQPKFNDAFIRNELVCIVSFRLGNIIKELVRGYIKANWRETT